MKSAFFEIIFPLLFALVVVAIIHPRLVKVALIKSIVDKPAARRLNKKPIPVLGGMGIFIGIVTSGCIFSHINGVEASYALWSAATIMLYTGVIDDILNIRAVVKLMIQIFVVGLIIFVAGFRIDTLDGLWGIYALPEYVSIPLTFLTGVGIINAMNLIDGIDGLSSGYGIITSSICGTAFYLSGNTEFTILSFVIAGSLMPFFVHNIFGRKYKMFMGDGGSLVLGLFFAVMIMQFIHQGGLPHMNGVVSFMLAVFAVPVFDTLRVMTTRMFKGHSPFSPDKTHLHHTFVEMGFHHPATTSIILSLDILIVGVWFIAELIPAVSIDMQFYLVVFFGLVPNIVFCHGMSRFSKRNPKKYAAMRKKITDRQVNRGAFLMFLQKTLDKI